MNKILPYDAISFDSLKQYGISTLDSQTGLNILKELSNDEAKVLIDSMKIIANYEYFLNKLREVDLNFEDFRRLLLQKTEADSEQDGKLAFININRLFLNFLNSWRIFVEFMETSFIRNYGKASPEHKKYKIFVGSLFDNYFSYRFFINLRNYSEHEGYPIYTVKLDSEGKKDAFFDKRVLMNTSYFKIHFENDIKAFNDYFPVLPQCYEALKHLQDIFNYFMNNYSTFFLTCTENIISTLGNLYDGSTEYCLTEFNSSQLENSRFQVIKNRTIQLIEKHRK